MSAAMPNAVMAITASRNSRADVLRAQEEYRRQSLDLAERLASALRKAPKMPVPARVSEVKPESAWPVVYYTMSCGAVTRFRTWSYQKAHTLTFHNEEAAFCGATHFAAWEPTGALRYCGPVLDALGNAACRPADIGEIA